MASLGFLLWILLSQDSFLWCPGCLANCQELSRCNHKLTPIYGEKEQTEEGGRSPLRIAENAQEPLLVNRTTATKDKIQNIRSPHFKKQDGIFFCFSAGPQQGRGPAGRRQMSRHGAKGLISGEQDTLSIKEGCRGRRTIPRPGCRASACDIWACPGLGGCWTVGRSP